MYVCVGFQRQDVIEDYVNYGSRVYAPILREGRFFDKNAQRCAAVSRSYSRNPIARTV